MSESTTPRSPRITSLTWGRTEVEDPDGSVHRYMDAKLFPGGSRAWDWNETGTGHRPGTQVADVEELVERGARIVVLSRGINERLRVPYETVKWLEERGVEANVLQTEKAVVRYNDLRDEGAAVGGLFHSTC